MVLANYLSSILVLGLTHHASAVALPQILPSGSGNGIKDAISPAYRPFQAQLTVPPIMQPKTTYTDPVNGTSIDFFEVDIRRFQAQIYPAGSGVGPTTYVGYEGMAPGPTFHMTKGREAVVRFTNSYDRASSIHLHGSYSRAPWDGWAADVIEPGEFKDYYYPNTQPQRTLWYHDHAEGITAVNAYFGQAGFYILNDPETPTTLPTGDYDIPLMISSVIFNNDGSLFSPVNERDSQWGDVITVNGLPWPYKFVEPRKYRFRLLDAAISRSFKLYLVDEEDPFTPLEFHVVGADAGTLDHVVATKSLVLSMAERYEIVIDFAAYPNKNLVLMNERDFQTNEDYPNTDKVIQFAIMDTVTSDVNNGPLPTGQMTTLAEIPDKAVVDHEFKFERNNGEWQINGVVFADIPNRVLAKPRQGGVERWRLVNTAGGWTHPIHIHLIDFKVVSRTGGDGRSVEPYEAAALKDVVYLGQGETVEVLAYYQPWSGVYMFHCHNLVHEDHDMMAAFNVTSIDLSSFGYPDNATFTDPMAAIWRAKPITGPTDLVDIQTNVLPLFSGLGAYPSTEGVEAALAQVYATEAAAGLRKRKNGGDKESGRDRDDDDDDDSIKAEDDDDDVVTEVGDDDVVVANRTTKYVRVARAAYQPLQL